LEYCKASRECCAKLNPMYRVASVLLLTVPRLRNAHHINCQMPVTDYYYPCSGA